MGQILSKPEYMGHTVNFRSHKQSYKDKNAVMNGGHERQYLYRRLFGGGKYLFHRRHGEFTL